MALLARDCQEIELSGSDSASGNTVGWLVVLSEESRHGRQALWISLGNEYSSTVESCS